MLRAAELEGGTALAVTAQHHAPGPLLLPVCVLCSQQFAVLISSAAECQRWLEVSVLLAAISLKELGGRCSHCLSQSQQGTLMCSSLFVNVQVLWCEDRPDAGSCQTGVKGRQIHLGEHGDCLHGVQRPQGRPQPEEAGLDAAQTAHGDSQQHPCIGAAEAVCVQRLVCPIPSSACGFSSSTCVPAAEPAV